MAFMELQSEFGRWYLVDGPNGTDIIPADVCGDLGILPGVTVTAALGDHWPEIISAVADCIDNTPERVTSVGCVEKWGARYSAPGYMDATDWVLADTQAEAEAECREMYGDEEEEEEEEEPTEPEEGDYTTEDHIHFYQYGKCVLVVPEDTEWAAAVSEHADKSQFWPDCWFISDHGNAHRINYYSGE